MPFECIETKMILLKVEHHHEDFVGCQQCGIRPTALRTSFKDQALTVSRVGDAESREDCLNGAMAFSHTPVICGHEELC